MNEVPRKFRPAEVIVSEKISHEIIYTISKLKTIALNHDNPEVGEKFMDAIMNFRTELFKKYLEDEVEQVPLYHHLTGSGMAKDTVYNTPINEEIRLAIEKEIVEFTEVALKQFVTNEEV